MSRGRRWVLLTGILVLAGGARLWGLTTYPPGLFPDQAANGEDALAILSGDLQVFSLRNNGRESLFFYVQALTVGLLGVGVWPMFLASAAVGLATVAATYFAGARALGPAVGLWAAFFLATNPWHVTLSRTGFRAVLVPLFVALTVGCFASLRVARTRSRRIAWAAGLGACAGLGLYTYPVFRLVPLLLLLWSVALALSAALSKRLGKTLRTHAGTVGVALGAFFLTAAPLALFFLRNPTYATSRIAHVSVFNRDLNHGNPWGTLLRTSGRTLAAFFWEGDGNPRHNVPLPGLPYQSGASHHYAGGGAPFLSLLPALSALVGLGVSLRRATWLPLLFLAMLAPAALTAEGVPHGLRAAGAIPSHVWLAGLGAGEIFRRVGRLRWRPLVKAGAVLLAVLFAGSAFSDLALYFGFARNSPLAHYEYRGDLTAVSAYINERSRDAATPGSSPGKLYLVLDPFSEMTVRYLTTPTGRRYGRVDPAESDRVTLAEGDRLIFTQSTLADAERYRQRRPASRVETIRENRFGEIVLLVLTRAI